MGYFVCSTLFVRDIAYIVVIIVLGSVGLARLVHVRGGPGTEKSGAWSTCGVWLDHPQHPQHPSIPGGRAEWRVVWETATLLVRSKGEKTKNAKETRRPMVGH